MSQLNFFFTFLRVLSAPRTHPMLSQVFKVRRAGEVTYRAEFLIDFVFFNSAHIALAALTRPHHPECLIQLIIVLSDTSATRVIVTSISIVFVPFRQVQPTRHGRVSSCFQDISVKFSSCVRPRR
jgi:hypothetical protein